jgi:hypothetical protein
VDLVIALILAAAVVAVVVLVASRRHDSRTRELRGIRELIEHHRDTAMEQAEVRQAYRELLELIEHHEGADRKGHRPGSSS